jgi:iron complex outermembrane receptor protein
VQLYNTNPINYHGAGLERTQAAALGNFKVNDDTQAYAELFDTRTTFAAAHAEAATFGSTLALAE